MGATFRRKNIRLPPENYLGHRCYFVTICTHHRRRIFTKAQTAAWIIECLRRDAIASGFAVHAYCVMPDHLHVLVEGTHESSDLLRFVTAFKHRTAKAWQQRCASRLWQFKYYDHILRTQEDSGRVAAYIWMNPVRKGLCEDPFEFPFSGSFTVNWKGTRHPGTEWAPPWKQAVTRKEGSKL